MRFDIITLFPSIFDGYLTQGILAKAIQRDLVQIEQHNLRDWAPETPHRPVDDKPFGGGPGMLIQVEPTINCVEAVEAMDSRPARRVLLTPQGKTLNQPMAENFATGERVIVLCGRYEGFDQRVVDILQPEEISIGDFVLNGGEVAAMVLIDAVVRLLPGVLGDEQSNIDDSFSRGNRILEFPQYTRPREFRGHTVPDVLLGGDHGAIAKWRADQSRLRTMERRSDLLANDDETLNKQDLTNTSNPKSE
ncbi:tRNA (guanosine(37)-N1)-methyltransferase TrmD [bacterium]|nr:tRNA (guanosine(37)-N1)-methyltransferase TrmD [Rhodopirellula sp.]MDA7878428.1 tRNA (guanosine(37)-N1)-methyltransferase TrmD [bacterium]MDA8968285.1 tRNA (guanosine(37)-N1)-methyltransferase TrmD [bacterium]MDB4423358.1 tRNA (guanosine(37)-N1)-methyltransferase TrmD [Rhodopirellula sp.]MDB4477056.1 tRNA (guanosine(37)-N1)-methyltransferase TrmD [Rhodopirellula sp.]